MLALEDEDSDLGDLNIPRQSRQDALGNPVKKPKNSPACPR